MALNQETQHLLRWAESMDLSLVPQFIVGAQNVVADSLSCRRQVLGSEWTLAQKVLDELVVRWPVTVNLLTTALNYWLPMYFFPPSILWLRHRCLSSGLGWTAGVRLPSFCSDPSGPE